MRSSSASLSAFCKRVSRRPRRVRSKAPALPVSELTRRITVHKKGDPQRRLEKYLIRLVR